MERKQLEKQIQFLSQETVDHDERRKHGKRNKYSRLGWETMYYMLVVWSWVPERWWKVLCKQLDLRVWA